MNQYNNCDARIWKNHTCTVVGGMARGIGVGMGSGRPPQLGRFPTHPSGGWGIEQFLGFVLKSRAHSILAGPKYFKDGSDIWNERRQLQWYYSTEQYIGAFTCVVRITSPDWPIHSDPLTLGQEVREMFSTIYRSV